MIAGSSAPSARSRPAQGAGATNHLIARPSTLMAHVGIAVVVRLAADGLKGLTDLVGYLLFAGPAPGLSPMTIRSSAGFGNHRGRATPRCRRTRAALFGWAGRRAAAAPIGVARPHPARSGWHVPRGGAATIEASGAGTASIRLSHWVVSGRCRGMSMGSASPGWSST